MIASTRYARARGIGWTFLLLFTSSASAETWRVTVEGQGTDLEATPIVAELNAPVPAGDYVLQGDGPSKPLPAKVFVDEGKTYLGAVLERVPGRSPVTYGLRREEASAGSHPGIELRPAGETVEILSAGKPFTVYRTGPGPKPFYFPVFGPTGVAVTRSYPMEVIKGEDADHPHQRSMWFTHGKVNGIDFWSEVKGHGSIRETSRKVIDGGPAVGVIRTTDDWLSPDGKKVLEDVRDVRFHDTGAVRIIDFGITLKATAGPVTFGDTKEGMFGMRVASSMDVNKKMGGKITNAEGLTDDAAWGKPSPWVDYTGPVGGQALGIAILNHPESFRFPTTWHVRTYGLFAANPFGWHDFGKGQRGDHTLAPGESIRFRYRVLLHAGPTASAKLPAAFEGYTKPPRVKVVAE